MKKITAHILGTVLAAWLFFAPGISTANALAVGADDGIAAYRMATDHKTEFRQAETAIRNAMWDYDVSNSTTKQDILKMAENALSKGSNVTVSIADGDFDLLKSTSTVNGTLTVTLTLTCEGQTQRFTTAKTVPEVVNEATAQIKEDRIAVERAVDGAAVNNKTTKQQLLEIGKAAVKNGTQISWQSFSMQNATFDEDGKITATIKFVLGDEQRTSDFWITIPKLERKVPTDKLSLNAEEWNILRLTNNARHAVGAPVLSMTAVLQDTTDIREIELLELFSHTRPNGKTCFTALPADYRYVGAAENIARALGRTSVPYSSKDATEGWINSPGHYANLINGAFEYVGMGFLQLTDVVVGVQMFSGGSTIVNVDTSAGTLTFSDTDEMQREYLICTAMDGTVSYLPIDIEQMDKIDGGYKLSMHSTAPIIFTITDGQAPAENETKENPPIAFSDVPAGEYYAASVGWAVQSNVTTGTSPTTFSPDDTCTRAQILTFMWRAMGSPEPTAANPFTDIAEADYYFKPAVWAYENGMLSGTAFEAETPCKRSDTMRYFWLYAGSPKAAAASFADVASDSEYFEAVNWAVANGITSGTSNTTFSPELICSRAQIVTFLFRAINILK